MSKILIVDDDGGVRIYLSRLLDRLGYQVVEAENGASGLAKMADPAIDAVLTDLNLPGEPNQMELVRQMRALRPACPIVVISGYPSKDRLDECNTLGVNEFLTKPFELNFIKQVLKRILDGGDGAHPKDV